MDLSNVNFERSEQLSDLEADAVDHRFTTAVAGIDGNLNLPSEAVVPASNKSDENLSTYPVTSRTLTTTVGGFHFPQQLCIAPEVSWGCLAKSGSV